MTLEQLLKLKQERSAVLAEARTILDKPDLSKDDEARFADLEAKIADLNKTIEREDKLRDAESRAAVSAASGPTAPASAKPAEFRNIGEFVATIRFNPHDPRLVELREQTMGVGSEGGFLVPEKFATGILSVPTEGAIVRPRATVISSGDDAALNMTALDQSAAEGMYAGVQVKWTAEGAATQATDAKFREVKTVPKEVTAHTVITDKLLRNASGISGIVNMLLGGALNAAEDLAFLQGDGVGKPLGIINQAGALKVVRAGANDIAFADVLGMLAKSQLGSNGLIWTANQSALPKIAQLKDANNNNIFVQGDATKGLASSLLGYPLYFSGRTPPLGSEGDLMLLNLSHYLIHDGRAMSIDASPHVYFINNKTVIRIVKSVDGNGWLTEPITLEDGSTQVSPFVILK